MRSLEHHVIRDRVHYDDTNALILSDWLGMIPRDIRKQVEKVIVRHEAAWDAMLEEPATSKNLDNIALSLYYWICNAIRDGEIV